jgi:predicted nucleic acid-binding protein
VVGNVYLTMPARARITAAPQDENVMADAVIPSYMLDTNVFDTLAKDSTRRLPEGKRLVATDVQRDELARTPNESQRQYLLDKFREVDAEVLFASSLVFDVEGAGWGQSFWNDGSSRFEKMLSELAQRDEKVRKWAGRDGLGRIRDIVIAETALKANAVLVSNDVNLCEVMSLFGGMAISLGEFLNLK